LSKSITLLFDQLRQGDDEAARKLWDTYSRRLVELARQQLASTRRRTYDEEDVANSVFFALCRGASRGRFPDIHNRDDLWRLLFAATHCKVIDRVRSDGRLKRGGGQLRGDSVFASEDRPEAGLDDFPGVEPTPEMLCEMSESFQRLLGLLRDDKLRQIALWRMEGFSSQEIADKLSVSERTIERKLRLIRGDWSKALESDAM
jgi:RNA polymerase sigma factor (sigma-70 family)